MELNFQIEGPDNAPVVVLSNSLGTTLTMWEPQMAALTAHYRVLRYDTHGHGETRKRGETDLARLGQDVIALLDHLDIPTAHFCGISMGGLTGLWLACHQPQRMRSVTVINSAARIGNEAGWRDRAQQVRASGLSAIADSAPERWFSLPFRLASAETVADLCQQLVESSAQGYAACCDALATADMRDEIADIQRPVLLIAGDDDPVTTVADAQYMHQRIAGSTMVVVKASHLSTIEAPDAVNAALLSFLGGQNAG
ncbi:3-oxoadipate enol-lactonase [Citrobacter sp. Cs237]|uniref:3-oxoadipate enol-lactonase n=1 Tax=Citrobacter TaxID=544 RepID=UPI001BA60468|nr:MULTISPECIES: 3-oxoadipate enol-lactonase [Citrobacter]EKJ8219075.1 3-oxoadipate enol-lactonase [Citrobacter sedlakii]EKX8504367.1 3-oxoadipate enol-lactonase [Citrobacter sedlakii]MDM2748992.1 3-oxoadipate enol-lactonase [Citrobacter sp. Cs237]QUC32150.1 3-oxoadipate enol-lactonase [Citrobacter sedlakii]HBU8848526.1 3-oxoadipate enol-lactonase [Citrobacter sedlakii]